MQKRPSLYTFQKGVTLVGGASYDMVDFKTAREFAPHIVAVDSGVDNLCCNPEYVIGDMDSAKNTGDAKIVRITEQDTTDLEKSIYSIEAPFYICVGFLTQRFDHCLAACNILVRYHQKPIFLVGETDVLFSLGTKASLNLAEGIRFSVFPFCDIKCLHDTGLEWSLKDLTLSPNSTISTSNKTNTSLVELVFDKPGAICILEKSLLPTLIKSYL
jgi:thiamine pyrophosphokinase